MSPFDRLHPALQHHIVNSLGWATLRPTQLAAIGPVLDGRHALLLAPTAGGKTEAAAFPVLSRMLSERWDGLSVLYVCPLRALLNNLEPRLRHYAELVGRTVGLWHGDVAAGERRRMLRHPPDILLTTPESLEAMLISRRVDHRVLFAGLRALVVDELHAFAGDDRGWHLLTVAERLGRIAGRPIQRIGLSATVGNPDALLAWLTRGDGGTVVGQPAPPAGGDVMLDHVGSLENAATVLSRVHRGEKRLVFCDSRGKVERLGALLRTMGVRTFVSHSSLGIDERRRSEETFATGEDCVIVATSTLELGIDVGDLDRVIQIDAPSTVSSFLQRMGRTGRRTGSSRNCLFLATSESSFLQAAGIVRLWGDGWVEPVVPPPDPVHLFAQQVMALILQERGLETGGWRDWVGRVFQDLDTRRADAAIAHMLDTGILAEDGGILGMGPRGESEIGRRNFMDLMAAFTTPLLLSVRYGNSEIGQIDPTSLQQGEGVATTLLLAGRNWRVIDLDWTRRFVAVEPSGEIGRSRWSGGARSLGSALCRAMEQVLVSGIVPARLSKRGEACLAGLVEGYGFVDGTSLPIVSDGRGRLRWWTFGGGRANAMLVSALAAAGVASRGHDDLTVQTDECDGLVIKAALASIDPLHSAINAPSDLVRELKFSQCLPPDMAMAVLSARLADQSGLAEVIARPVRLVRDVTS
ncbi:DEAD/DEAH box helicase [Azospirillum brasilense]|uniref:DEAD/DEAH box helicase n=1 Tax=Azospirillum brasilense TaxID=192 RepID=UPI000E699029|nr:DEAD/DEAH box helicase [Azospirillum brasilense]NUB25314.1 DEAD/DEAH box helicase [Azospirillum brasilense]NUB33632.1 DEAD/DEAH box helicase [Azospirillum brasilense]RIW01514.1 ATP-dependent helicase [Azospirillum brasilense]